MRTLKQTPTFKGFIELDDIRSSKIRKKMNKKDPKKREWGAFESVEENTKIPLVWQVNRGPAIAREEEEEDTNVVSDEGDYDLDDENIDDTELSPDEDMDDSLDADLDDEDMSDPNKQGIIRVVKGAHLVYKRQNEAGGYDELWIFNTDDDKDDELDIRRDILAGTDIPPNKTTSEDDSQSYSIWTAGNAQLVKIQGLPN